MREPEVYTKKPVDIEAMQYWNWSDALTILQWGAPVFYVHEGAEHSARRKEEHDRSNGHVLDNAPAFLIVKTLEGDMRADQGDFIIKGVQGEFYPCKPDIFKQTYDRKNPKPERTFPIGA